MKKSVLAVALLLISPAAMAQKTPPAPLAAPAPIPPAAPAPAPVTPAASAPAADDTVDLLAPPVATPPAVANDDWMKYRNPYTGEQNNLANPNRTKEEIAAWTQKAIASALSFTPEDINEKITAAKKMFIASGWAEYAAYVKNAQLLERVRNQRMSLSTILNGDAIVLGSEAVAGTYHWLVRAPVMITFFSKDASGKQKPAGTGKFELTLQIGRVEKNQGEDGIAIESWKIEATDTR